MSTDRCNAISCDFTVAGPEVDFTGLIFPLLQQDNF